MYTNNKYCSKCNLHKTVEFPMLSGKGYTESPDILVLATHPIIDECKTGNPWISRAEAEVERQIRLHEATAYYSYAVKCTPYTVTEAKKTVKKVTVTEMSMCSTFTTKLIRDIRPKVVLCLGAIAMKQVLGFHHDIMGAHKKSYYHPELDVQVVVTWDTLQIINEDTMYMELMKEAVAFAVQVARTPQQRKIRTAPKHLSEPFEIQQYLEKLSKSEIFAFDLETTGLDAFKDRITDVSLCCELGRGVHILWSDIQNHIDQFKALMESNVRKIGHNAAFDVLFLKTHAVTVNNVYFDTMIAGHTISMSAEGKEAKALYALKIMAWFLTTEGGYESVLEGGIAQAQKKRLSKEVKAEVAEIEEQADLFSQEDLKQETTDAHQDLVDLELDSYANFVYNTKMARIKTYGMDPIYFYSAMDSDVTLRIYQRLKYEIDTNYNWIFHELIMPVRAVLTKMSYHGCLLDLPYMDTLYAKNEIAMEEIKKDIFAEVGHEFNIDSADQLGKVIYGTLKIKPDKDFMTKGGKANKPKPSTDTDALKHFSDQHPVLKDIIKYRNFGTQNSTYIEGFKKIMDDNNRVHPDFKQASTATGRLSCIAEGTSIRVVGGDKYIEVVEVGDFAHCYDSDSRPMFSKVVNKFDNGLQFCIRVHWQESLDYKSTGCITLTSDHLLRKVNGTWLKAFCIAKGDLLLGENNKACVVTCIESAGIKHVWDLEIENYHNFIANKLNVHNCTSPNLQNIPRDNTIRNMIIAPPGRKIVSADLSQAELRVLAMLAQDKAMIAAFASGLDFHTLTACNMFGIDIAKFDKHIKEHAEARTAAKCVAYSTRIPTAKGLITIRLLIDDVPAEDSFKYFIQPIKVINPDGNYVEATQYYEGGLVDGNVIQLSNGMHLEGSDDHKVAILQDNALVMQDLKSIKVNDIVLLQGCVQDVLDPDSCIDTVMRISNLSYEAATELIAYVWMYGSISKYAVTLTFSSQEQLSAFNNCFDIMSLTEGIFYACVNKDAAHKSIIIRNTSLFSLCEQYNLCVPYFPEVFWRVGKQALSYILTVLFTHKHKSNANSILLIGNHVLLKNIQDSLFIYFGILSNIVNDSVCINTGALDLFISTLKEIVFSRKNICEITENNLYDFHRVNDYVSYVQMPVASIEKKQMYVADLFVPNGNMFNASGLINRNCINFGVAYQQSAKALAFGLKQQYGISITVEEAENFINKFYRSYPDVAAWIKDVKSFAMKHGYVETLYGRKRYLPGTRSSMRGVREAAMRRAVNTEVQSPASDIACIGLIRMDKWLTDNKVPANTFSIVHDDILIDTPDEYVEDTKNALVHCMTWDLPKVTIPIVSDPSVYTKWEKS